MLHLWIYGCGTGYIEKDSQAPEKLLEGFANAWSHAVQLGNVLCKAFNRPGNVALAHAVAAVNVAAALAVIG